MEIKIDAPGAGEWVMEHIGGSFRLEDHAFTMHRDEEIIGGFVLNAYLGSSMSVHMAGDDPHWCSRELLWLVFHYAFVQVGCRKLLAPISSDNYKALALNLRAGWQLETVICDVFPDAHLMVLSMTRDTCPWLEYDGPRTWKEAA